MSSLSLLLFLLLHSAGSCRELIRCPFECICDNQDMSADCRGGNETLTRVIQELPAELERFRFTVCTHKRDRQKEVHIDLNSVPGLDKFQNLSSFQVQPYSQSAPFVYNSRLRNDIFCNWTHLEEIHLNMHAPYDNASVQPFSCLQQLKVLDLSYSRIIPDATLKRLLSTHISRQIKGLLLRNAQTFGKEETAEIYFSQLFSNLNRSSLEVIDLSANAIRGCHPGLLLFLNLRKLDLSENLILSRSSVADGTLMTVFEAIVLHPSMEVFSFADPGVFTPRGGESSTGAPYIERLANLPVNYSHGSNLSSLKDMASKERPRLCSILKKFTRSTDNSFQCICGAQIPVGRHLKLLNASGITKYMYPRMNYIPKGRFCFDPDNVLETVDLSNMHSAQFIDNPYLANISVTGLNRIEFLNLKNNDFMIDDFQLFDTLPSLQKLLLGGNKLQIYNDSKNEMFQSLGNLSELDLSRNDLHSVPDAEFVHLSKLKHLNLSGNKLHHLNISLPNSSLEILNLSNNGMTFLRPSLVQQFDRYPDLTVDLHGNNFICNCETLWFVRWVQTTSTQLSKNDSLYCYTRHGHTAITNLDPKGSFKHCHRMSVLEVALMSASVALGIIFFITVLVTVYRQRWRIRHFWYRRRLRQERAVLNDDYEYDAYVSYSDCSRQVRGWVSGAMHEELECRRGLRLFIHQRDLLAGGFCLERIDAAMSKCRKTILVLSPDFLQSRTCLYEAWSAHTSMVTEGRDAVILVKLQTFPLAGITGTLASLMQVRECLNWTQDPIGQHMFWEQLEDVLLSVFDNPIIA